MKQLVYAISDNGDGSSSLHWFIGASEAEVQSALDNVDWFQSGDGVQTRELKFPDDFDLDSFCNLNHLYPETLETFKKSYGFD